VRPTPTRRTSPPTGTAPGSTWRDTRVVERNGRVVGYAVLCGTEADSVVHPALRDQDLQARLLAWLEAGGTALEHYSADVDPALSQLFVERGWTPARRFWRMRRELDGPTPAPVWPADVRVHAFERPADERPVHALVQTAFAEIGGQHARTLEQWSASLLDTARFDAALCPVVTVDAEVVAAALSQSVGDCGFVRQLAVVRSQRGRGLGLALLHECFSRHRDLGLPATVLGVDAANATGALDLYARAGMRAVEQFTRWERAAPA
jgi:mycothiol synthase